MYVVPSDRGAFFSQMTANIVVLVKLILCSKENRRKKRIIIIIIIRENTLLCNYKKMPCF